MDRSRLALAALAIACTAAAAAAPLALAQVQGGSWEITGVPGSRGPVRQCVADPMALAQYEHRGQSCRRSVISSNASVAVVEYSCGGRGFGRTRMTTITPRSLRIETQGVSDGLPFNYVLQARRAGDCSTHASAH